MTAPLSTTITALDGKPLSGTWFLPSDRDPVMATLIVCGGGLPAKFYSKLADYLSSQGIAVLTFDFRGIGGSRPKSLRGFHASLDDWAELDIGGALNALRARFPALAIGAITHSISALLIGAATSASHVSRLVAFGPHAGYWRDYRPRYRWLLFAMWHWFMPLVTKIVGFFPGRSLGMAEDLPREFAMEWGHRRSPSLEADAPDAARRCTLLKKYQQLRCQTLVLSMTDDAFAPPPAASRFVAAYPNLTVTHKTFTPDELHVRRLGHLGFLRRPAAQHFWDKTAAWLLHGSDVGESLTP